ncbi:uncharacterized protein LOC101851589 [Aplysia californica]|uniref:Uncharacterized protein LOC101851589 n=1 Tax=Aplysia californica TaxID=6500 RepID=A0ABM1A4I6_APLCA|nr:uncharacterized protein LOC101851589 [Aplysia californica]
MDRTRAFRPSEIFFTNEMRAISELVMDFIFSFVIAIVGVISNMLVIVVFAKQGFSESVNISMTTIALWDFAKCLGGAMQRMAGPIKLLSKADAESWTNISVVIFNYLICFSSYVTSALAAYVAVERCLCVSIPFKVKWLLTPKVTLIVCIGISVVVFGSFVVIYGIYDIYWLYNPTYNTTTAFYRYNDFFYEHRGPLFEYYNLSGIIWPTVSFVVIVVSTSIIVSKLREGSKFRASNADVVGKSDSGSQLSSRDRQVVKMLVVIIGVYVFNLSPRIALYMAKYFIYEFYFLREYHNLFVFVCYFLWVFDLLNGAINFFIFYKMSTSFRDTFLRLICLRKPQADSNKPVNKQSVTHTTSGV